MNDEKRKPHNLPLWRCNQCGITAGAIGYALCPKCKTLMKKIFTPDTLFLPPDENH